MPSSRLLCILAAGLLAGALSARSPQATETLALGLLQDLRPALGLEPCTTFLVRRSAPDALLGGTYVRVDQYYQGVKVLGGEAILHLRGGRTRDLTDGFKRGLTLDAKPGLTASEALAVAIADLAPAGPFAHPPTCELVVARRKLGPGTPVLRDALVYHVHVALENGVPETAHVDYLVDAHTGAIARRWDSLETVEEVGTGHSQYSGTVSIITAASDSGFELRDPTRGKGGNRVVDLHHGTGGGGKIYASSTNTWGDGENYRVCSTTAGLEYWGESGGLNEANSDINGTMVEFYSRNGDRDRIGDQGGNWTMGEQLATKSHPKPLRFMYKPSLDHKSPDAWSEDVGELNVHRSSGPMNRCFFFMSQGSSDDKSTDFYTSYLPKGMGGLGNDVAAHIWYRAMATYMTSDTDYAGARQANIKAARDLYGAGGPEEQAVWNAFHGINVGGPWTGKD
ncbi:MAG: M4 family metallopeptidase [Holophaga sp.]